MFIQVDIISCFNKILYNNYYKATSKFTQGEFTYSKSYNWLFYFLKKFNYNDTSRLLQLIKQKKKRAIFLHFVIVN